MKINIVVKLLFKSLIIVTLSTICFSHHDHYHHHYYIIILTPNHPLPPPLQSEGGGLGASSTEESMAGRRDYPTQAVFLAEHLLWTESLQNALVEGTKPNAAPNALRALKDVCVEQSMVRGGVCVYVDVYVGV